MKYLLSEIITKKMILDFTKKYPKSKSPLENCYKIGSLTNLKNFDDLRSVFPPADQPFTSPMAHFRLTKMAA